MTGLATRKGPSPNAFVEVLSAVLIASCGELLALRPSGYRGADQRTASKHATEFNP